MTAENAESTKTEEKELTPAELVSKAYELRKAAEAAANSSKAATQAFEDIKADLAKLGVGKHGGLSGEHEVNVIEFSGSPSSTQPDTYALPDEKVPIAKSLLGDTFKKLFERLPGFRPCAGFAEVLPKLVAKVSVRDALMALCRVPGAVVNGRAGYFQVRFK